MSKNNIKNSRSRGSASDDLLHSYYARIRKQPLLSAYDERELSRRIQNGDKEALNTLIEANLKLVAKIAWEYIPSGVDMADLVQEGNLGLINAAGKFDFHRNVRFSTYASWWIKQGISRAISNKRRAIRIPYRKEEALRRIKAAINVIYQQKLRTPSCEDIAEYLHISYEEVVNILNISENLVSFDSQFSDKAGTLYDFYEDCSYVPDQRILMEATKDNLRELLDNLDSRDRFVITKRYGIWGNEKLTLKELSMELDLSTEAVRQIEIRAIAKLQFYASNVGDYIVA